MKNYKNQGTTSFVVALVSVGLLLSGCAQQTAVSKFDDTAFLTAKSVAPLVVPEALQSTAKVEPYYPAPAGRYPAAGDPPVSLLPPNFSKLLQQDLPVQTPLPNN